MTKLKEILQALIDIIKALRAQPALQPKVEPKVELPPEVVEKIIEPPVESINDLIYRICKEEGLSKDLTNQLWNTIKGESNFNPRAINHNKDKYGKILSTDYGLCQWNDYYHIGKNKTIPTVELAYDPEYSVRKMAQFFRAGKQRLWMAWQKIYL